LTKYAKIEDNIRGQTVSWEPWAYLLDLLDVFEEESEIRIGKARQLGISWLVCGYAAWTALFRDNAVILLFSQGESEAWLMVDKCNFILTNLPDFLKREAKHDRRDYIKFASNNSFIKALPSTEKAGRAYTATLVIRDEVDYHEYAEQNFSAVGPTVDAGGKMIDLTTRNKDKAVEQSHFMQRWLQSKTGAISGRNVFLGWRERPVRDHEKTIDEWFDGIRKKYPPYQVEKEYPATEDEFLSEALTTKFFNQDGIDWIRRDCYSPIDIDPDYPTVKIWAYPEPGLNYCSFLDPSNGGDPHAAGWMETVSKRIVCVSHGRVKAEVCADIFDRYNRYYNNAYNEFELNGESGRMVAQVLDVLATPNRRMVKGKHGWYTAGSANSKSNVRDLMLDGLEEAVRNKRMRIHYAGIPNEMDYMIKKESEKPRVPATKHDDLIMMLGGLWQISKETQFSEAVSMSGACEGFA
jgi:hypothetical protein|tara:strand:- start:1676 stop:3070 length:1395 start_codon:yes stop_codon:yes gene_type:complete